MPLDACEGTKENPAKTNSNEKLKGDKKGVSTEKVTKGYFASNFEQHGEHFNFNFNFTFF